MDKFNLDKINNIISTQSYNHANNIASDINRRNEEMIRAINTSREEKEKLESDRHEEIVSELKTTNISLKKINTELAQANETLRLQLTSVNNNLDFILNSLGANSQRIQSEVMKTNVEIAKLKTLLEFKDEKGVKEFISEHGIESIGLILQVLGMFMGA